jgi:PAS domain S-box-containing protein
MHFVSPAQAIADPKLVFNSCHPQDRPRVAKLLAQAMRDMGTFRAELRVLDPTGGERWASLMATPTLLPNGTVAWDGVEIDITEFKARERAVLDSERLFRESQRAADIGSYETDLASGAWTSSEVLDQIFGIGPAFSRDIQGWVRLIHPDDQDEMSLYLSQEVLGRRHRFNREYRIVRQDDGVTRWVLGLGELVLDADGQPARMIGTIQDITERRAADQERERLMTAVEQAGEAVVITDPSGVIEYVNPAFERVSGYSLAEAKGHKPSLLKSGLQGPEVYAELWRVIRGGRTWRGVLQNKRKDGGLFTEEVTISPVFGHKGEIRNFVAVKHDISDSLRLAAQFQQSQRMEMVGRLAGGVAHDFNNMLGVILAVTELTLMKLEPSHPLHANLMRIQDAARRSADLTRQLMVFARKQPIEPRLLDLNRTVGGMMDMLRRLIGEHVQLRWQPGPGLGPVRLDPTQLDQVLVNLCVNARDAIATTGQVTVSTALVQVDAAACRERPGLQPGAYAVLSVADDGAGMDAAVLAQAFEPFFTTKRPGKGTGLGLAIIDGIAQQNHGFIEASSVLGQGTTFRLHLPIQAEDQAPDQAPKPALPPIRATVLLLEDEPALLELTATMLQHLGCRVLAAATPQEALDLARRHGAGIDLVLTDVIMPQANAAEVVALIEPLLPGVKVLYMSGYSADVISRHGVLDEGVHFLAKPFNLEALAAKLKQVLG